MHTFRLRLALLLLFAPLLVGCGDSFTDTFEDPIGSLGSDTGARVPHQNWNSYRLYQYQDGEWDLIVDLGNPLGERPLLGERPVMVVHGLGSSISSGRFDPVAASLQSNGATSIFGFEYDTLDSTLINGAYFRQALEYLTTDETDRTFRFVAHSMGTLVARVAFESGTRFQMSDRNIVSFVAGPHLGTEIAAELISARQSIVNEALAQVILHGELEFFNADGSLVDVSGSEASFWELVPGSDFLNALNTDAASSHPQFVYRTLAGTERGRALETFNRILGTFADDGLVDVESANASIIGPVSTETVPYDHSEIVDNPASRLVILDQLEMLP